MKPDLFLGKSFLSFRLFFLIFMENFLYLVEISRKDLIVIFYDFYHQLFPFQLPPVSPRKNRIQYQYFFIRYRWKWISLPWKKIYLLACRFLFYFSNLLLFLCAFQSFLLLTRHWLNLFHQKKTEASCINIFLQVASLPPQRGGACELECVRPSFYHLKWKKNLLFHRLNTVRWESTRLFFCWLFFFFFTFYWKATPLFRSAGAV